MNKIEKLINELCPNGVEFKKLKNIITVAPKSPFGVTKLLKMEKGNYLTITSGKKSFYVDNFLVDGEYIFVNDGGQADIKYNFGKTMYSDHIFAFKVNEYNTKYLYFYLLNISNFINKKLFIGSTLKNLNKKKKILNLAIPIPPISIQNKIVEILDKYTELETELELRNKQYIYYRNELLDFNKNQVLLKKIIGSDDIESIDSKIEFKKIGDIGNFYSGLSGKNKNDFFKNANARYITYLNVFNNLEINVDKLENVRISKYEKQNKVEYGDILITISSETPDECGYVSIANHFIFKEEDIYLNSFCFGFRLHNLKIYNIKYFKYLFKDKNTRKKIIKCVNGVTRFNLSKEEFKNISIPIPPISIQNKIVEILDKLEVYTKDINTGLPLEIEQRKKQYEYYRNKLLDFDNIARERAK